jgi:hypothetical protein
MKTVALFFVLAAAPAFAQAPPPASGHGKAEFLRTYDADTDGAVARAEFDARRAESFSRTDADKDGALSETEYVAEYTARLDAELAATRARQIAQAHVRFGVMDADKSAAMSRAEYNASGARSFTRLDTNGDGLVNDRDTADRH